MLRREDRGGPPTAAASLPRRRHAGSRRCAPPPPPPAPRPCPPPLPPSRDRAQRACWPTRDRLSPCLGSQWSPSRGTRRAAGLQRQGREGATGGSGGLGAGPHEERRAPVLPLAGSCRHDVLGCRLLFKAAYDYTAISMTPSFENWGCCEAKAERLWYRPFSNSQEVIHGHGPGPRKHAQTLPARPSSSDPYGIRTGTGTTGTGTGPVLVPESRFSKVIGCTLKHGTFWKPYHPSSLTQLVVSSRYRACGNRACAAVRPLGQVWRPWPVAAQAVSRVGAAACKLVQFRGARGVRGLGGLTCHWPRA